MFAGTIKTRATAVNPEGFHYRAGKCIIITIAVICVCILTACGVLIVREYALGISYIPTLCRVSNVTYAKNSWLKCMHCSTNAKSKQKEKGSCVESSFPCVQVLVNYKSKEGSYRQGKLHRDSIDARGQFNECSFNVCHKDREDNMEEVEAFSQTWKSRFGKQINCFYNTDEPSSVIEVKNYTKAQVIHSMFWPSLVMAICGVIFLRLEMTRRHLTFCGAENEAAYGGIAGGAASRTGVGGGAGATKASSCSSQAERKTNEHLDEKGTLLAKAQGCSSSNSYGDNSQQQQQPLLPMCDTPASGFCDSKPVTKTSPNSGRLKSGEPNALPIQTCISEKGIHHEILGDSKSLSRIPDIRIDQPTDSKSSNNSLYHQV